MENSLEKKFEDKKVRVTAKGGKLYYSVVDVVEILTDSTNPKNYWNVLKSREIQQAGTFCIQIKLLSNDGKLRLTDCADEEGILRIIQSIPSPKAEPFKRWLARLGRERLEELRDPELGVIRARERAVKAYERKGHDQSWIEQRVESIEIRNALTNNLKKYGAEKPSHYAKITEKVHVGAMGVTVQEHKEIKGICKKENLRDNLVNRERQFLVFAETDLCQHLGEENPETFKETSSLTDKRSEMYTAMRLVYEKASGKPLVTSEKPSLSDKGIKKEEPIEIPLIRQLGFNF